MRYSLLIVLLLLIKQGISQENSELPFIKHLIDKEFFKEAIHLIDHDTTPYGEQQRDSINYYKGWAFYSLKRLEESTQSLLKVNRESAFFSKSYFFSGYNQLYLGNYSEARKIFGEMNIRSEPDLSLLNLELGGLEMLEGNWTKSKELLDKINKENAALHQQVFALQEIRKEHETHRSKSPVLAGIISGIIPGSGKIYAGKTGSGIASMIGTIGFGFITWENYRKAGITNAKTLLFGSIFAVNYVSNIYGSVISVKIIENEHKNAIQNQVLFQLHLPLRNFFE